MTKKDNTDLATRIITKLATVNKIETGIEVNAIDAIGFRHVSEAKSEKKAVEEAIELLSLEFDNGNITLSSSWEKDNL